MIAFILLCFNVSFASVIWKCVCVGVVGCVYVWLGGCVWVCENILYYVYMYVGVCDVCDVGGCVTCVCVCVFVCNMCGCVS